jgi:hypothetical protein
LFSHSTAAKIETGYIDMVFTAPDCDRHAACRLGLDHVPPLGVPFFSGHLLLPAMEYLHRREL